MLTSIMLHNASTLFVAAGFRAVRPVLTRLTRSQHPQCRFMSQHPRDKKSNLPSRNDESFLPEAPLISKEEIDILKDLARDTDSVSGQYEPIHHDSSDLPEPPPNVTELNLDIEDDIDQEEDEEEIESIPYIPPKASTPKSKMSMIPIPGKDNTEFGIVKPPKTSLAENCVGEPYAELSPDALGIDPSMMPVLAAWARAVVPTANEGPMPLHELANRSTTIKELVKLGVDFSRIVERHGDMERLLHLSWTNQIKPHIRFLVDCGIHPDHLGTHFTRNTALLWTNIDDMQVRVNYLEAKQFTCDEIKNMLNKAPFWLTLPTKEIDNRLGFLQRTFHLQGSEVRLIAATFPTVVSSQKWELFVDSTKLMDREFGFDNRERKDLLFQKPQCYMRPKTFRMAFDYCHNTIGLTHTQLVRHASLLVQRVNRIKPRHQFLKFLNRDIFNDSEPNYLSPDWLWKGNIQEFCEEAAKTTIEDYECFLKYSMY